MVEFTQQLLDLLLIPPGNLIYHLVLAFSIAGALLSAMSQRRNTSAIESRRTVIGLSLLLIVRLGLFLAAAIAWQGNIDEHFLLPPIDRAVTLISLVIIAWLWCFPKPHRSSDAWTIFLGLATVILAAVNLVLWIYQGSASIPFNRFEASLSSDILALTILSIGIILIIILRPNAWGFGLVMFVVLAAGHLGSIFSPSNNMDYSGAARLMQMIAYPLLFTLPQRFIPEAIHRPSPEVPPALEEHRHHGIASHVLQSFLSLGTETDPDQLCQSITVAVAHSLVADVCFLASPPDEQNDIVFESGYDLIREEPFPGFSIKEHNLPALSAAMLQNQMVHIPADSDSLDLTSLAHSLNISNAGHLLASPITNKAGEVICALVLITPYSKHPWSDNDQSALGMVVNSVAQILQRHLSQAPYREEISALQQKLEAADQEIYRLSSQINAYESIIGKESSSSAEPGSQVSLAQPLLEYDRLDGHKISALQEDARPNGFLALKTEGNNIEKITGELHLALEEIDRLNKKILELEQADREYINHSEIHLTSGTDLEMTARIAQALSSPLSSINGYTDFLLAESFGSLGPIQRKFVERIKFSCERISHLLEVTPDSNVTLAERLQLHPELINLSEIINSAIDRVRFEILEKKLSLDKIISEDIPSIFADRDALDQILTSLLENAINVTPEEGKISLRVVKKESETESYKALIQVSDQGGIRAPQTPYQVFTSQPESDMTYNTPGNIDMTMLKELVEMQGGSIWFESEEGSGVTFNVLMPVSAPQDVQTADQGENGTKDETQTNIEEGTQG